jgi:hypothetical protein
MSLAHEVKLGFMNPKRAIYYAVEEYCRCEPNPISFLTLKQFLDRMLPKVVWEDEALVVDGKDLYWSSEADFLRYFDGRLDGLISVAAQFLEDLKEIDAAHQP